MAAMNVQEVVLSKNKLDRMTTERKRLLFLAGHMCNELSMLRRLMSWSLGPTQCEDIQEHEARTSQALFLLRILTGKLYEAKNTLNRSIPREDLRKLFDNDQASESFNSLDKFMAMMDGHGNMFRLIRNKLLFHTDDIELISRSIEKIPNDSDLRMYYNESQLFGNYYVFSDIGVLIILAEHAGQPGLPALNQSIEESLKATELLVRFLASVLDILLRDGKVVDSAERIEISGIEAFLDVSIPYFTAPGGSQTQSMPMTVRFPQSLSGVEAG